MYNTKRQRTRQHIKTAYDPKQYVTVATPLTLHEYRNLPNYLTTWHIPATKKDYMKALYETTLPPSKATLYAPPLLEATERGGALQQLWPSYGKRWEELSRRFYTAPTDREAYQALADYDKMRDEFNQFQRQRADRYVKNVQKDLLQRYPGEKGEFYSKVTDLEYHNPTELSRLREDKAFQTLEKKYPLNQRLVSPAVYRDARNFDLVPTPSTAPYKPIVRTAANIQGGVPVGTPPVVPPPRSLSLSEEFAELKHPQSLSHQRANLQRRLRRRADANAPTTV